MLCHQDEEKKCAVRSVGFSGSGKEDKIPVIATPDNLIGMPKW